ncbi:MAG: hypothetical protein ABR954_03525 [Dehalococcoidales bacterium]
MRISSSMLWRLSLGILILVFLLMAVTPVFADTGTYRITDYTVRLEPQSDGQVRITVTQQWQVTGGDIPWVTVGLPNSYFSVEDYSGAVSKVSPANDSSFSGVRIDLDKDYTAGQTFEINFTVLQQNLLERLTEEKKWRISYTPGWYDRAAIDHLRIDMVSPIDYQSYSLLSPTPTTVNGNVLTWKHLNLSPGGRFNITMESSDGGFLAESVPVGTSTGGGLSSSFYIAIVVVVVVGLLIFWSIRQNRKARDARIKEQALSIEEEMAKDKNKKAEVEKGFEEYVEKKDIRPDEQGRYYDRSYGNYVTPAIWYAIIATQMNQQRYNAIPRSGCVSSCACACVSCACACACACAGGGAAGCSRKTLHRCRQCQLASNVNRN